MSTQLRVGYVVSRFPAASETFVIRELDEVAADGRIDVDLFSLFSAGDTVVHDRAVPWVARLVRLRPRTAAAALVRISLRSPRRSAGIFATVVAGTWRRPALLARNIVAAVLGFELAEQVQRRGISHIHAHFAAYPTLAAWVCRRLSGVTYSFTAHAYDIFIDQSMLATKVQEATFVATISEFNQRFLEPYDTAGSTPVELVHCGVDPDAYPFEPSGPPPTGPVKMLCVASLEEKKGHTVLLSALASNEALERIEVDLVGGGELLEPLQHQTEELGLTDRVRFLGGRSEEEVRALLEQADLFVLPSVVASDGQMEGLPVALIEALATGTPVVTTRMSGIPELVRDERIGLLAEPGDSSSLAGSLERALTAAFDPSMGRETVVAEFDVRESGARMVQLFLATADSPKR